MATCLTFNTMTYKQIKKIAYAYQEWSSTTGNDYSFDLWASEPGKKLMEKLNSTPNTDKLDEIRKQVEATELLREGQTQAIKNSTAIFAYGNIAKIVTGVNPLVSQPSNLAPVSPDDEVERGFLPFLKGFYSAENIQCQRCKMEASDELYKNAPAHTCGKDGDIDTSHFAEKVKSTKGFSPDKEKECPDCGETLIDGCICQFCAKYAPTIKRMDRGELGAKPLSDRHEALVREIAEEMGKDELISHGLLTTDIFNRPMSKKDQSNSISRATKRYLPAARITAKRMTEEFKSGYEQAASDYGYANAHNDSDINAYLIERGLIPEKEAGNYEDMQL